MNLLKQFSGDKLENSCLKDIAFTSGETERLHAQYVSLANTVFLFVFLQRWCFPMVVELLPGGRYWVTLPISQSAQWMVLRSASQPALKDTTPTRSITPSQFC